MNGFSFKNNTLNFTAGYFSIFRVVLLIAFTVLGTFAQSGAKDTNASADNNLRSSARINPSTLAMEMTIPLGSYPGRAGNSVPVSISYSSKVWEMKNFSTTSINSSTKYRHNAIFSNRTASGWTSSMQPPRLRTTVGLYDSSGEQYTPHYQSMMIMPEIPFEYNASGLATATCVYFPQQVTTDDRYTPPRIIITRAAHYECGPTYLVLFNYSMGPYAHDLTQSPRFMVKRFYVTMPDGSSVEFRKDDNYYQLCDSQNPPPTGCLSNFTQTAEGTYLSVNGTGMRLEIGEVQSDQAKRNVLYIPNGGKYIFSSTGSPGNPAEKFVDVNGNETVYQLGEDGDRHIVDTLGRTIDDPFRDRWYTPLQETGITETILKGVNAQDLIYEQKRMLLKTEGCESSTSVGCGESALEDPSEVLGYIGDKVCVDGSTTTLSPALFVGNGAEKEVCGQTRGGVARRFNPVVLTEITLPDGSKYKFKYNIYGEITRIDYPTGGYERFRYAEIPPLGYYDVENVYTQTNRGIVERWVSVDGVTADQHWTYEATSADYPSTDYFVKSHAPDGSYTERHLYRSDDTYFGFSDVLSGMPYDERVYDSNGVLRSRQLTEWTTKPSSNSNIPQAARDPRVKRSVSIMFDPNSSSALATMSETDYDETGSTDPTYFSHLNVKRKKGCHYAAVSKTSVDDEALAWTTIAGWFTGKLASVSETDYWYNSNYRARGIIGLPTETRALNPTNLSDVLSKNQPVYDEGGVYFIDEGSTTGYAAPTGNNSSLRANVTTSRTWVKESNTWLQTHTAYDNFGNVRKVWDATGDADPTKFTETQYSADYYYAYPTKAIAPAPDTTNTHGTNQTSTAETTYDFTTGLVLSVKDDFGQITTTEYDSLQRPKRVNPVVVSGVATGPVAETDYGVPVDGQLPANQRFVKVKKQIDANNWDESTTWFDGLGRTIKTAAKDSQGDVTVETHYDLLGRVDRATSPYRAGDTVYWSKTRFDEAGRAVESYAPEPLSNIANAQSLGITSFGISTMTNYVGTVVTTTDASGRKGRSITNALGQLLRVDEPTAMGGATADDDLGAIGSPAQPTYYKYDLYGNMVQVTQGVQNRYFKYDSLGRLIRVNQPEQEINTNIGLGDTYNTSGQWTAAFTYDVLGNVVTATDAKHITVANTYDRAGRVTSRGYYGETPANFTPPVLFFYDGKGLGGEQTPINYAKGKLTAVSNGISETRYKLFDNFGRLKEMEQRTPATNTETTATAMPRVSKYTYNLSGALIEEEYPSGRKVKNEFESDGDLKRIYGKATSTTAEQTYANSFTYTPDGKIEKLKLGNGLWESAKFNNRLQVTELALGHSVGDGNLWKLNYEYGELVVNGSTVSVDTNKNTGNIARQTVNFSGLLHPFVQTYKYDPLYRLTEARETKNGNQTWKQTFGYDRYGNRTAFTQDVGGQNLTINNLSLPTVDTNTNRFQINQGYSYDKNGNITNDPANSGRQFVFNGDNKQVEVKDASGNTIGKYYYDGEGKRVKKVIYPGTSQEETTVFVYSGGKLAAEYSTAQALSNPNIHYTATDQLGSPRVLTGKYGEIISRRDFMPFGEEIYADAQSRTAANKYSASGEDAVRKRFTGYEKDKETGLDFAEARYYNNQHARFTAVDPLLASGKSASPQTFNRYVYVMNSPLRFTDKTGLQAGGEAEDGGFLGTIYTYLKWVTRTTCWNGSCTKSREQVEGSFDDIDSISTRLTTLNRNVAYNTGGQDDFNFRTSAPSRLFRRAGGIFNPTSAPTVQAFNDSMEKADAGIQHVPVFGSLYNSQKAAFKADMGTGSGANAIFQTGMFGVDLASTVFTGGGGGAARKEIALGVERIGSNMVLSELAEHTGASMFKTWAADGLTSRSIRSSFGRAFNQAANRADRIHFALDGLLDDIPGALRSGASGFQPGNFTNAELHTVFNNSDFLKKTVFYFNNNPVSPLFR